jgi:hypothetical protein
VQNPGSWRLLQLSAGLGYLNGELLRREWNMTKAEVEQLAREAMNIPGSRITTRGGEVARDEVDCDDNPGSESHPNNMDYCPGCGMKLPE